MPFSAEIIDNHDRDHGAFQDGDAEPREIPGYLREIVRLQDQTRQTGTEGAKAALRLGIGLYNRTGFGNYRMYRSLWGGNSRIYYNVPGYSNSDSIAWDLAPARRQFERAARDLPTGEGRAWATWLIAKCERDSISLTGVAGDTVEKLMPTRVYKQLRDKYSQEKFWTSALKECGWLRTWNRSH